MALSPTPLTRPLGAPFPNLGLRPSPLDICPERLGRITDGFPSQDELALVSSVPAHHHRQDVWLYLPLLSMALCPVTKAVAALTGLGSLCRRPPIVMSARTPPNRH